MLSRWPRRVRLPGDEEKNLGRVYLRGLSTRIGLHILQNCVADGIGKERGMRWLNWRFDRRRRFICLKC